MAATSSRDVWAVGTIPGAHTQVAGRPWMPGHMPSAATNRTLILHWNGRKWRHVPSPSPSGDRVLAAVSTVSARNARAVGAVRSSSGIRSLILHWNGRKRARAASPNAGSGAGLQVVTATCAANAWAVGAFSGNGVEQPLILRWNGRRWSRQASPRPGTMGAALSAVAAASADKRPGRGRLLNRHRAQGVRRALLLNHSRAGHRGGDERPACLSRDQVGHTR